jgi:hypothetical protein
MKTIKKSFFSPLFVFLFTGLFSTAIISGTDLHKTYTWKYIINKDANVVFENYNCNMIIHTWDKNETEYHLTVDAKTRTEDDAAVLENYLDNLKFSNSPVSVRFKDNFWESRTSILGKTTMKLAGGKDVNLGEITMKGELWIPSGCKFELISKYSEINMEDFSGQLNLDLYNDSFYGANVAGNTEIEDKYSTIEFKKMKDLRADLYNSKLEADGTGNVKAESKYSKFTAASSERLDINSYNDKYSITKTGDITFNAKYSDLKTELSGRINLDCYEGSVIIKEAKDIKLTSKYADFEFDRAENISVSSSYNDKLVAGRLNSLRIDESKYCSYRIDDLINSVTETEGYEDKFSVLKTGQEFKEISINGKYINISLSFPKSIDFRFRAKITYPDLEINESQFTFRNKVNENSQLDYDAVKGTEKEGMPLIEINGYEMSLKMNDI